MAGAGHPPLPHGLPVNTCPCSKGEPSRHPWGFLCDSKPSWDSSLDRGGAQCIRMVKTQRNKCHGDPAEPQIHLASRTPPLLGINWRGCEAAVPEGPGCPGSEDVCLESCPQDTPAPRRPPTTHTHSHSHGQVLPAPHLHRPVPFRSPGSSNLQATTPVRRRSYLQNTSVFSGFLIT